MATSARGADSPKRPAKPVTTTVTRTNETIQTMPVTESIRRFCRSRASTVLDAATQVPRWSAHPTSRAHPLVEERRRRISKPPDFVYPTQPYVVGSLDKLAGLRDAPLRGRSSINEG